MKCAFKSCKNEPSGAIQFNELFRRIYLCTEHLIATKDYNVWKEEDFKNFMELLKTVEK